jgi:hypothetical protein
VGDPNYEGLHGRRTRARPRRPAAHPAHAAGGKFYDQIAWLTQGGRRKLTLGFEGRGGNFEFDRYVMRRMERVPLFYRISDHHPPWVEVSVPSPA